MKQLFSLLDLKQAHHSSNGDGDPDFSTQEGLLVDGGGEVEMA